MLPGAESSLCMGCIMFSSAESECAPHMQHVMDRRQMGIGDMSWLMLSGMASISVGHQMRGMERWSAKESNMYSSYFTRDIVDSTTHLSEISLRLLVSGDIFAGAV